MSGKRVCPVVGCGKPHDSRGYCKMHYMRLRNAGDLDVLPRADWKTLYEVDQAGCWIWQGRLDRDGYGCRGGSMRSEFGTDRAHRAFYMMLVGEIPEGLVIDHLCRVTACVNPDHLEPVTPEENTRRGENFLATNRKVTHCPQGHVYAGENLVIKVAGNSRKRVCRTCRNAQALHAWRRKKGIISPNANNWYEWQDMARSTAT